MNLKRTRFQKGTIQREARAHGSDVWVYRWYEGKRRRSRVIGTVDEYKTESLAAKAAGHLRILANADQAHRGAVLFGDVIQLYLENDLPERKSTGMFYRPWINNHIKPRWSDYPIGKIKILAVEEWIKNLRSMEDRLPLSKKSKEHIKSLMCILFDCAMRRELIDVAENPMRLLRIRGVSAPMRERRVLTIDEWYKLRDNLERLWRMVALLVMCLGPRINEALALQWPDFDWGNLRVKIDRGIVLSEETETKTENSRRDLPLDPSLAEELLEYKRQTEIPGVRWCFPNPATLKPYHYNWALRKLIEGSEAAGLGRIGWHDLRHSYSQLLAELGTEAKVHQGLLRHADFLTSMNVYTRRVKPGEREAHGKVVKMVIPLKGA